MLKTHYERSYGVSRLAGAPLHPATVVYLVVLAAPLGVTAAFLDPGAHPVRSIAVFVWGLLCAAVLMEGDARLASWPPLYAAGEKLRPLVEHSREPWRAKLRLRLRRVYDRSTRPLWLVLIGIPLLWGAQDAGLVTGFPQLTGGVGLTASGVEVIWNLARAFSIPWLALFALTLFTAPDLDLPELRPDERLSEMAKQLPLKFFAAWRVSYFLGMPLLAWLLSS
jgi:hypothetical protein